MSAPICVRCGRSGAYPFCARCRLDHTRAIREQQDTPIALELQARWRVEPDGGVQVLLDGDAMLALAVKSDEHGVARLREIAVALNEREVLRADLDVARARVEELGAVIERDRTRAADILTSISRAMQAHSWLREGRGSYEYDDDRWRNEFGCCLDAIDEALKPLAGMAADWSDCPLESDRIKRAREVLGNDRDALRGDLDAARARIEELEAAQAWQPIETAPKDGTRILWCHEFEKRVWVMEVIRWPKCQELFEVGYWRPLPKPPGAAP